MSGKVTFAESIYSDPKFNELVKKRRNISLGLFGVCMTLFFLIPVISSVCPDLFRVRVIGSINLGLIYMVAQYAIGGLIAWRYASQLVHIDEQYKQLITSFQEPASLSVQNKSEALIGEAICVQD